MKKWIKRQLKLLRKYFFKNKEKEMLKSESEYECICKDPNTTGFCFKHRTDWL